MSCSPWSRSDPGRSPGPEPVAIRGPYITLGDLLKRTGAVPTGGQAKRLIQSGTVRVNGEVEVRRGRKLYPGDTITLGDASWIVAPAEDL